MDRSITGDRLIDELDRIAVWRGYPSVLRCDNGPELACDAMADWAGERVGLSFIPPGEPWRNGYVESFNARVRDEWLNINIFWSLVQARVVISDWKHDYNHRRRHSSPGTRPRRSTLRPAPTDERLSHEVDQFSGSGHELNGQDVDRREVRVISAFRDVVRGRKEAARSPPGPEKNIGTVHTVQEQESDVIVLVLRSAPNSV